MNLFAVLKYAVVSVLTASLLEALVLTWRHKARGGPAYDWRAAAISVTDFLVREFPLRWALPAGVGLGVGLLPWAWEHRLFTLPLDQAWGWAVAFLLQEFCYYWYHRAAHRMRWFWCTHAIHHSSNDLNLSAAYRFGWTGRLTGTLLFFALMCWLGVPPKVAIGLLSLNLLYQFWVHATWIPRLGPLEWVLNTPSAHRVHHASNLEYLDGNYGGVLIVFDRLFGTYIPEQADIPCRYGLVQPVVGHNLWRIEFGNWLALWRDLRACRSLRAVVGTLLMPPGWKADGPGDTTEELRARAGVSAAGSRQPAAKPATA